MPAVSDGNGDPVEQETTIDLLNVTAVISGTVFLDANNDGVFDGGTEIGIDGVIVELFGSGGGLLDTDLTEMGGIYAFEVHDEFRAETAMTAAAICASLYSGPR